MIALIGMGHVTHEGHVPQIFTRPEFFFLLAAMRPQRD